MTVNLDHLSFPARDKGATGEFLARVLGVTYEGGRQIRVGETLTLNLQESDVCETHHYAFRVTQAEFEHVLSRLRAADVRFGSSPQEPDGMPYNRRGRLGVYFFDPNGHDLEVITTAPPETPA